MVKKIILSVAAVFVAWFLLDIVIHSVILGSMYQATPNLWRPMEEMKMGLMYVVILISAFVFVYIYARFFAVKGIKTGLLYGLLFGIGTGASMGYGSFSVMPLPCLMAHAWFLGSLVEATVAGLLVGLIIKS
jgi:hypothetical protein